MDRRSAAAIAFSCTAIFVVVTAINQFGIAAQQLAREIKATGKLDSTDLWLIGVPAAVTIALLAALALVLIARSHRLAARLFPEADPAPAQSSPLTPNALHQLAFTVVGLVVLCFAVPELIYLSTDAWRNRDDLNGWTTRTVAPLAAVLVQIFTGYVLFFFPNAALRLWSLLGGRLRS